MTAIQDRTFISLSSILTPLSLSFSTTFLCLHDIFHVLRERCQVEMHEWTTLLVYTEDGRKVYPQVKYHQIGQLKRGQFFLFALKTLPLAWVGFFLYY